MLSFYWYSSMKKKIEKDSVNFWHRKVTLKVRIVLFCDHQSYNNRKTKHIFMAIFLVLWPYLSTTKLNCLQKINFGRTKVHMHICQVFQRFLTSTILYDSNLSNPSDFLTKSQLQKTIIEDIWISCRNILSSCMRI